jgi:hypothetical protein
LLKTIGDHEPKILVVLKLEEKAARLATDCVVFREWRNRALAHRDWGRRADPLPSSSKELIENALALIRDIMGAVEEHFTGNIPVYQGFGPGDANALVRCLEEYARCIDEGDAQKELAL